MHRFNAIVLCQRNIHGYIWPKSHIHTWIYPWIYPWISISTASLNIMLSRAKNGHLHARFWWHRSADSLWSACIVFRCFSLAGDASLIPVRITFNMIGKCGISGTCAVMELYTQEIFPTTLRYSFDTILSVCKYK